MAKQPNNNNDKNNKKNKPEPPKQEPINNKQEPIKEPIKPEDYKAKYGIEDFLNYINEQFKQSKEHKKKLESSIKTLTPERQTKIMMDFNEVLLAQIILLNSLIQVLISKGTITGLELGLMNDLNQRRLKDYLDHLKEKGEDPFMF